MSSSPLLPTSPTEERSLFRKPVEKSPLPPVQATIQLLVTKLLLRGLQHRERRQDRVFQNLSDQTGWWAVLTRFPVFLFRTTDTFVRFSPKKPSFLRFPGRAAHFGTADVPLFLDTEPFRRPGVSNEPLLPKGLLTDEQGNKKDNLLQPSFEISNGASLVREVSSLNNPSLFVKKEKNLSEKTWVQTKEIFSSYRRIDLGESPLRYRREGAKQIPKGKTQRRNLQNSLANTTQTQLLTFSKREGERLSFPLNKVKKKEKEGKPTLETKLRWQEKRLSLLQQGRMLRHNFRHPTLRFLEQPKNETVAVYVSTVSPRRFLLEKNRKRLATGSTWTIPTALPSSLEERDQRENRRKLPYQSKSLIQPSFAGLDPTKSQRIAPAERWEGPVYGPRRIGTSNAPARLQWFLQGSNRRYDRQDSIRLSSSQLSTDRARYAVRSERQQEAAEERQGESNFAVRRARRLRENVLLRDRPYRAIRGASFTLGRRVRPLVAARTRPLRRREERSQQIQRAISKLGGWKKVPWTSSGKNRLFLPTHSTSSNEGRFDQKSSLSGSILHDLEQEVFASSSKENSGNLQAAEPFLQRKKRAASHWSRYVLNNDLPTAQARRRWWRQWHQLDPRLYGELRRAGSVFRDRTGRRNMGWWRSLAPLRLDSPYQREGRERLRRKTVERKKVRLPLQQTYWRDQRLIPLGWASRLQNPESLERVLARDLGGNPDPTLPYWSLLVASSPNLLTLSPFTFVFFAGAWQIRKKAYESVQKDFLRAREALLRRGGVRELDPEWMGWLLEALGISRASAGIRTYPPGRRSRAKSLAGLRRDFPTLIERIWYLRSTKRGIPRGASPRPTLLVGAPGTGKTSLVRILADEAAVPVVYQCLAAFTDAGARFTAFGFGRTVAPQAVQRGFQEARNLRPSILFLDEVDALGANRGQVAGDESSQSSAQRSGDQVLGLGQLLVEVDSAKKNEGRVLFAATNRPARLDPALVRPGRFDRTVSVPLPNRSKRIAILKLYTGRFPKTLLESKGARRPSKPSFGNLASEGVEKNQERLALDWGVLADQTRGRSAAHLASLTNWAAISSFLQKELSSNDLDFQQTLEMSLQKFQVQGTSPRKQLTSSKLDPFVHSRPSYYRAAQWIRLNRKNENSTIPRRRPRKIPRPYEGQGWRSWKQTRHAILLCFAGRIGERRLLKQNSSLPSYWQSTRSLADLQEATRLARLWRREESSGGLGLLLRTPLVREFAKDTSLRTYAQSVAKAEGWLEKKTNERVPPAYMVPQGVSGRSALLFQSSSLQSQQTEEWPSEWYAFEIAEIPGFRAVGWVPPELSISNLNPEFVGLSSFSLPKGKNEEKEAETQLRKRLRPFWNESMQILRKQRGRLDLLSSLLFTSLFLLILFLL